MKPWHWAVLGVVTLGAIYLFSRRSTTIVNGAINPAASNASTLGAGIGGLLSGLFSGNNKVSAPSAGNIPAGTNGVWDPSGSAWDKYTGTSSSSSSDPLGIGPLKAPDFSGQASGGTDIGGGLTSAQPVTPSGDPFGLGTLTAPNFSIGTQGSDFSN